MKGKLYSSLCLFFFFFLYASVMQAQEEGSVSLKNNEKEVLFFPITFDSIKVSDFFSIIETPEITYKKPTPNYFTRTQFQEKCDLMLLKEKIRRKVVNRISVETPDLIDYCNLQPYDAEKEKAHVMDHLIMVSGLEPTRGDIVVEKKKINVRQRENRPWEYEGNLAMQFSQYYVTDNWYKGGTPNATFLSILDYIISYRKNRFMWENDFDIKIGFYNTELDTIRAFRVNNDVFDVTTLAAYQTWFSKKVYYSAAVNFKTSFLPGYKKTNSNEMVSTFLSPTRMFFSLGMECRYNNKTTIRISPLASKLLFIVSDSINRAHVGLDSTETYVGYPGCLLQAKIDWRVSKEINLQSKVDFFSSYKGKNIEFDWEVIGKFIINRFLSTRLSLIMRYDNTPKDEDAKVQIQEQLSFGFNYVFRSTPRGFTYSDK
ncbi:MAG: DUF3078 domain-containing protein [Paludibacteraceae bacterium]|nr:DUF3078 domain-containing protein [Paludibacteraceae bacterium]